MALPVSLATASTFAGAFTLAKDLQAAGIIGWPQMRFALTEIVPRIASKMQRHGNAALQEMVSLARSRVPVDSGNLLNGISGSTEGDYHVLRANAVKPSGGADYARFVEFGTKAGVRGRRVQSQSLTGFYSQPVTGFESGPGIAAPRTRNQYRSHPGTDPQPYFYNSAREVMERRFMTFSSLPDETGRELGF